MLHRINILFIVSGLFLALLVPALRANSYKNFNTAIYTRVYEVQKMDDLQWLQERFDIMQKHIRIDKVYLETHRDMVVADQSTITKLKKIL